MVTLEVGTIKLLAEHKMILRLITTFAILMITAACESAKESDCNDSKYGFFAHNDDEVREKKNDPAIVGIVLGCVYNAKSPTKERPLDYVYFVNVADVFYGKFRVGDRIRVTIFAESGPSPEQVKGRLFYYCLAKDDENKSSTERAFTCDWTEVASYARYGQSIGNALKK